MTWRSAGERSPGAGETPLGRCGRGAADAMMLQGRCSLSTTVGCLAGRRASGLREEPNSQAIDSIGSIVDVCGNFALPAWPCGRNLIAQCPAASRRVTSTPQWQTPKDSGIFDARSSAEIEGAAKGGTRTPGVGWPAVPDRRPRREPREDRSTEWRGRERD